MYQLHYNEMLEYINKNRVSIDEWDDIRIYYEDDRVCHLQVSQMILDTRRKKSLILKKNELVSWIRDEKLKKLLE
jgi:hypothetical protein